MLYIGLIPSFLDCFMTPPHLQKKRPTRDREFQQNAYFYGLMMATPFMKSIIIIIHIPSSFRHTWILSLWFRRASLYCLVIGVCLSYLSYNMGFFYIVISTGALVDQWHWCRLCSWDVFWDDFFFWVLGGGDFVFVEMPKWYKEKTGIYSLELSKVT